MFGCEMVYFPQDLQVSCSQSEFVIGQTALCSCSSDIASSSIRWYDGNSLLSSETMEVQVSVTTDNHGDTYTCAIYTDCGDQEKTITVNVTGIYSRGQTVDKRNNAIGNAH